MPPSTPTPRRWPRDRHRRTFPPRARAAEFDRRPWAGATRSYDIVKEFVVALVVVSLLTLGLAAIFSSPDDPSVTTRSWARAVPTDFVSTTAQELAGTSGTATYGPPYNSTPGAAQTIGPLDLQSLAGVRIPIDTANDFVIRPLEQLPTDPATQNAVATWKAASPAQQVKWASSYADAVANAKHGDYRQAAPGDYGPVPALCAALLDAAQRGALDGVLQAQGLSLIHI